MTERLTPTALSITIAPMVLRDAGLPGNGLFRYGAGYDLNKSMFENGNGSMTAHSREEVARITRRLGGRMKP
ncbi:hypothetical protein UFOVP670_10 [uncultured Caudovirales phage]|uniref:Uncharacterized protein n=1 Tax=uncultured Caudovirales phage TaxID=2100421 RepID=A0A6J5NBF9_9CAUD|nr:hypothetical protein UFOVP670_10 [uncultured Caudovirales phage]